MQNTSHHLLEVDTDTATRIRSAYEQDAESVENSPTSFNDWLLAIVMDWVHEVEKPTPSRDFRIVEASSH